MKKNKDVKVTAEAVYLLEPSAPEDKRFLWSYDITIENATGEIVQLLNRYWRITDMTGHVEEVRGPGVVGLQPLIKPEKKFSYSSFCQLSCPQGTMEGYYEMQTLNEERFIVEIPKFILTSPTSVIGGSRAQLH